LYDDHDGTDLGHPLNGGKHRGPVLAERNDRIGCHLPSLCQNEGNRGEQGSGRECTECEQFDQIGANCGEV
jgi:hypothetical protein